MRARRLDAAVGVEQLGRGHADVVARVGRLLERLEPAPVGDHVAVEQDDVAAGLADAAVGVAGKAELLGALDDLGALELGQAAPVLGVGAGVVAHDDLDPLGVGGAA